VILALAVCAVLAGARSVTAIADWATYSEGTTRAGLGIIGVVPSESTIRWTLQAWTLTPWTIWPARGFSGAPHRPRAGTG
jgi:hypothetical protein